MPTKSNSSKITFYWNKRISKNKKTCVTQEVSIKVNSPAVFEAVDQYLRKMKFLNPEWNRFLFW